MKRILNKAIKHYGKENQIGIAQEEAAELIQSLSKSRRGLDHNVSEEIADVEIMLEQLKIIFNCANEVKEWKKYKLNRLNERIKNITFTIIKS